MSEKVVTESFGAQETRAAVATASADTAVASQMQAQVEARCIMAMRRPRNMLAVRAAILDECKRPRFAESAYYRKPIGGGKTVDGLSIRFAEAAMRNLTNMHAETIISFEDATKRIVRVQLTDLEANACLSQDITIEKTVERRKVRQGQQVISKRANSYGDMVYIVEATESEVGIKQAAEVSKILRNHVRRMLPGDIQDEAEEQIKETLSSEAARDPQARVKRLADAFGVLNVQVAQLESYLGHPLQQVDAAEVVELHQVYRGICDRETTWHEVMESKRPQPPAAAEDAPAPSSKRDAVMAKISATEKKTDDEFQQSLKRAAERGKGVE